MRRLDKRTWAVLAGSRHRGHGGGIALTAAESTDGKTFYGRGVKPGSTVTIYSNGTTAGTAVADASGNWSYTFAVAQINGTVIGWDGVVSAPAYVSHIPPTLAALT